MTAEATDGGKDNQGPATAPAGEEAVALVQPVGVDLDSFAVIHDEPYLSIVYEDGAFTGELVRPVGSSLDWAREVGLRYGLILDGVRMGDDGGYMELRFRELGGYDI